MHQLWSLRPLFTFRTEHNKFACHLYFTRPLSLTRTGPVLLLTLCNFEAGLFIFCSTWERCFNEVGVSVTG
jgi:hypothetical protein